jgi:hypothetical protein
MFAYPINLCVPAMRKASNLMCVVAFSSVILSVNLSFAGACNANDILLNDLTDWLSGGGPDVVAQTRSRFTLVNDSDMSQLDGIVADYKAYWNAKNIAPPNMEVDQCTPTQLFGLINQALKKFP